MHITSSAVQMNSSRRYAETWRRSQISSNWNVLTGAFESNTEKLSSNESENESTKETGNEGGTGFSDTLSNLRKRFEETKAVARVTPTEDFRSSIQSMRQNMINYLLQILFGKKADPSNLPQECIQNDSGQAADPLSSFQVVNGGVGGQIQNYFYYSEHEEVSFEASASVHTADGRTIDVNMSLSLSRTFVEETSDIIDYGQPLFCDPLVLNFDGPAAKLTDQKFYFDLDSDGTPEEVNLAAKGSGFLAYDKNEDGMINDGSELFGTKSGNGFADLAQYDSDGNGWIDEADEIFQKLKIWYKDDTGKDKLMTLQEAGVGALYLGSQNSQFSLTDQMNHANAMIRRTGLFLYENGSSGTIQQLDLATTDMKA